MVRIAECVRITREAAEAQTDLLRSIDREQVTYNRTVDRHE
ncbi:hypothetical protein SAMN04487843_104339 [Methylobacterium sp. ap11]|nr:hypothetical protein SAMN04487843_104339 [Methylobacterium sp. ap11]